MSFFVTRQEQVTLIPNIIITIKNHILNIAVILLKEVTIKIFPGPDFSSARRVLIA